jgi:hypothetical protein
VPCARRGCCCSATSVGATAARRAHARARAARHRRACRTPAPRTGATSAPQLPLLGRSALPPPRATLGSGEHGNRALERDSRIIAPTRSTSAHSSRMKFPSVVILPTCRPVRHPPDHQFRAGARQRERQHWSSSSIPRAIVSKRRRTPCHDDSGGNAPREE